MTTYNDDLHELTASEYCNDVVKKGLNIEFDVALYIIETSKNIPHLGSAIWCDPQKLDTAIYLPGPLLKFQNNYHHLNSNSGYPYTPTENLPKQIGV